MFSPLYQVLNALMAFQLQRSNHFALFRNISQRNSTNLNAVLESLENPEQVQDLKFGCLQPLDVYKTAIATKT
jgi:hypothetical protein